MTNSSNYSWAVIGSGPAGITSVGLLLDMGIPDDKILWIDPEFSVGDFGHFWGDVHSNTSVALFHDYFTHIKSFDYNNRPKDFEIDLMNKKGFTPLNKVSEALQWITNHLACRVDTKKTMIQAMKINNGLWELKTEKEIYRADKVIMATGSKPNSLKYPTVEEIDLPTALSPSKLTNQCHTSDTVAVFGSSHSAMIIIKNLVESGVKHIVNFYQSPFKFALAMEGWTLYDNTGLKGETAAWVRDNLLKNTLPEIKRYISNNENIEQHLPLCNKAIYAVGFTPRILPVDGISLSQYDDSNGIIAPGLFGAGIGFPLTVIDPNGRKEKNVGLWKFYKDLKKVLPIWQRYGL